MAYVAMNLKLLTAKFELIFLNGVCRHERGYGLAEALAKFLNGVCRHERRYDQASWNDGFLNGVCRHEP